MSRKVIQNDEEPAEVRKLREDVYAELPVATTLYTGVIKRENGSGSFIVNIDGADYEYRNFTAAELNAGDSVAVVRLGVTSGIIVGVKR